MLVIVVLVGSRLLRFLVLADLLDGRLLLVERAFGGPERRLRRAADLLLRGLAVELGDGVEHRDLLRRRQRHDVVLLLGLRALYDARRLLFFFLDLAAHAGLAARALGPLLLRLALERGR